MKFQSIAIAFLLGSISAIKINAEWPTIQPAAIPEKPEPPMTKEEREAKTAEAWSNFNDTVHAHKKYVEEKEDKAAADAAI